MMIIDGLFKKDEIKKIEPALGKTNDDVLFSMFSFFNFYFRRVVNIFHELTFIKEALLRPQ